MITFIDMDGVIADFYAGAHKYMGVEVDGFPYKGWYWPEEIGFDYRSAPISFWENLPKTEDADIWMGEGLDNGEIVIATCPSSPESIVGKQLWMRKHYPKLENRMIFTKEKWLLAGPDKILYDDNSSVIKNFNKAGGHGLLVKRPWSN